MGEKWSFFLLDPVSYWSKFTTQAINSPMLLDGVILGTDPLEVFGELSPLAFHSDLNANASPV